MFLYSTMQCKVLNICTVLYGNHKCTDKWSDFTDKNFLLFLKKQDGLRAVEQTIIVQERGLRTADCGLRTADCGLRKIFFSVIILLSI